MSGFVIKFVALLTLLALSVCCLFGCRSKAEIGDMAVVLGAALSVAEDGLLQVSIELAHQDGNNAADVSMSFVATADSWAAAEEKLSAQINKQLYFGHMVLLVLDQDMPPATARDYLQMFYQDQRLAPTIYVAWTEADTQKLFASKFGEAEYASKGVAERLALELKNNRDFTLTLSQCMQHIYQQQPLEQMAVLSVDQEQIRIKQLAVNHE